MATTVKHLLLYEVGHGIDRMPYDGDFQLIIYGIVWASMVHNVGEEILGDPVFILPLEGNLIATQDQQTIYTYHKWRGGQHGVGYFVCHDQIFSPPTLSKLKVEDDLYELPFWRVAHFVWIIAWGWRFHMGMIVPNEF